jgi:hypothetical protein
MTRELRPGTDYTALIYDPQPSASVMRSAGTRYPAEAGSYTSFSISGGPGGTRELDVPVWSASGPPSLEAELRGTPYAGMYALARRLAAGARDPFQAVHRIDLHLRAHYTYRQDVPNHRYPLPAFLEQDREGYCQQFSGAMALMLRMLGIPSRVASGFAPGGRDPDRNNYLVDDTDAHNWVEVFFPSIGWVTFDPTPGAAPAATQLDDNSLGVTKPVPFDEGGGDSSVIPDTRGADAPLHKRAEGGSPNSAGGGSGPSTLTVLAGVAGAAVLFALAAYAFRWWRRSRMEPDELARAELGELDRALERIGSPLPPGATLTRAEGLLADLAGTDASRYAARLRDGRYRRAAADPPDVHERRALRRALVKAAGRRSLLRVLLAVPPGGPSPRTGRGGPRTNP